MATTAARLKSDTAVDLFYYLKITGLPYYFFSVIDPTSSTYGASAWSLPAGYSAVKGMDRPNDTMTQSIRDIVGGMAEPERIRLRLIDFSSTDSAGEYKVLSRLFAAPGRFAVSTPVPELETRIRSTDGSSANFTIRNCPDVNFFDGFNVHIGTECIGVDSYTDQGGGRALVEIAARNKFPCATGYPPTPYHRVYLTDADTDPENGDPVTATGIPGRNQYVTDEPITMIGRTAALYIGHMTEGGKPAAENLSMMRLLGRITSMNYESADGTYELEIQSLIGDLEEAVIAPGLAQATIQKGYINLAAKEWRTFEIVHRLLDDDEEVIRERGYEVVIDNGDGNIYTSVEELLQQIQVSLREMRDDDSIVTRSVTSGGSNVETTSQIPFVPTLDLLQDGNGNTRFAFMAYNLGSWQDDDLTKRNDSQFIFQNRTPHRRSRDTLANGDQRVDKGLLTVLGFDPSSEHSFRRAHTAGELAALPDWYVYAELPPPSVFIPYGMTGTGSVVQLAQPSYSAGEFFSAQAVGSEAYVRFGDGGMAVITAVSEALNRITVSRAIPVLHQFPDTGSRRLVAMKPYYRVSEGEDATVSQVFMLPSDSPDDASTSVGDTFLKILASGDMAEGFGFGWDDVLDTSAFAKLTQAEVNRRFFIDSTTKFSDMWMPIAREYGYMLVWDPENQRVTVRKIHVPSGPVAHTVSFTESNRVREGDRTSQRVDASSIRSAWTLKWGWDTNEKKFLGPEVTWSDRWVLSAFGNIGTKSETIEDKTIWFGGDNSAYTVIAEILSRSYFYRQPWLRCERSLTKAGLCLAPGSVHQIVDTTLINPFTGAVGVTASDRVYGLLMSVQANPATGECRIEYTVNRQDPAGLFRWFSPCALVDFTANSGGSTRGYNSTTGVLTLVNHFASDGTSADGIDFAVGDTVALVSWDNDNVGMTYYKESTITAKAADGTTVTVAASLAALSSTSETIMILREYQDATADRLLFTAFQGKETGQIGGASTSTAVCHKWL